MAGYSSDGSSSFFTSETPNEVGLLPYQNSELNWEVEIDGSFWDDVAVHELSGASAGLTDSQINDDKKQKKRQSDFKYRQKRKRIEAEHIAEIESLKVENECLKAANVMLRGLLDLSRQCHQTTTTTSQLNLHQNSQVPTCNGNNLLIKHLIKELDRDDESNVSFSDFAGLDGERVKVGRYYFPQSLRAVVNRITAAHGDVSATSKMNLNVVETTYILFCASIKEMGELQLEQVTEGLILKWRDTIRDALRINFKVGFAMEHLKKIARAYICLIERRKVESVAISIAKLEADLNANKEKYAKIVEQFKEYIDAVDEFGSKPVSEGMFQCLPIDTEQPLES